MTTYDKSAQSIQQCISLIKYKKEMKTMIVAVFAIGIVIGVLGHICYQDSEHANRIARSEEIEKRRKARRNEAS